MAISGSPAPTSFRPEFSFTTSSPSDRIPHRPSAECGYVSRQALGSVEKFVEDCLVLDRYLGLDGTAGSAPEACCLVTPPGYAILDTGCTSTLVGSENEQLWQVELEKRTGGSLQPEQGESDVRFEGINGETRALHRVKYPVRIGSRDGFLQASVIPGKAPFLLSIQALRAMKARLDCEHDVLEIPGIGKIPLEVNSVGHYLLPLLNFSNRSDLTAAADHGFVSAGRASLW